MGRGEGISRGAGDVYDGMRWMGWDGAHFIEGRALRWGYWLGAGCFGRGDWGRGRDEGEYHTH